MAITASKASETPNSPEASVAALPLLVALFSVLGLSGLAIGYVAGSPADLELTLLLQLMALVKLGMVGGAIWLVAWRCVRHAREILQEAM
jgi:hypothetical protein